MRYELNDLLSVETDVDVTVPEYYAAPEGAGEADIVFEVAESGPAAPGDGTRRIGSRYDWDAATGTLYLDWNVPLDLRASITGLGSPDEQTVVRMSEQYENRGAIDSLFWSVLVVELHAREHTLIHGGCLHHPDGGAVVTGWDDMGKTSTCLSMHDRAGFSFMGDDAVILGADGTAHAWEWAVGISPYTSTGNIPIPRAQRVRILLKRGARLVPGLGILHSSRETVDVTDVIEHRSCSPETVFFLEGGDAGPREISAVEGARRLVESSNADKSLVTHDAVETYAYLHERVSGAFEKRRRVVEDALADMHTVELCSEDKEDYPEWIPAAYPTP